MTMHFRERFVALVAVTALVWLSCIVHVQAQVSPPCGTYPYDRAPIPYTKCSGTGGLTKSSCLKLNRQCLCQYGFGLKWRGPACQRGLGDGGCECANYCGYKCATKCNSDRACYWTGNYCVNRQTGDQGTRGLCIITQAPTTERPSHSPTFPQPTSSPVTSAPSKAPTRSPTRTPSSGPTKTPTRQPTMQPSMAPIIPTYMPSRGPGALICKPSFSVKAAQCARIREYCVTQNILMKFTGPGCILNGYRQHDGGCQCNNYCGYSCFKACNRDSQCWWDVIDQKCRHKVTNTTGTKIKLCNEEPYPITG